MSKKQVRPIRILTTPPEIEELIAEIKIQCCSVKGTDIPQIVVTKDDHSPIALVEELLRLAYQSTGAFIDSIKN